MKIRIIEDLETELKDREKEYESIRKQLIQLFDSEDFYTETEINGISFNKKEGALNASFYVSNDMSYKGYVTRDTENQINYSVKGKENNVIKAANQVIDAFYNELESEDIEDV